MIRLYWKLVSASIRAQMEYKASFLANLFLYGALTSMDFLLVAAILLKFDDIQGWNLYEVGYLYAMATMVQSIYRTIANEIHAFEKYTVHGELDQLLIRPVSPLFILLTRQVNLNQLGGLLQGALILIISLIGLGRTGGNWEAALIYLPVGLLLGTIVVFSIALVTATTAIWIGRISELQAFTMYAPLTAASFPIHIYPEWLRGILYSILPVAFIAYVPSLFLFDKGGEILYLFLPPLVSIAALAASLSFWQYGLKHYHSTGT
jgi:ABC-2 type transport system permease protein